MRSVVWFGLGILLLGGCGNEQAFVDSDGDGAGAHIDCNDEDATVYPGAEDIPYDEIDQDCDGNDLIDADGDGVDALSEGGDDCDDTSATVFPGASETPYDDVDQDCDGSDLVDVDGDAYVGTEAGGDDCDDAHAETNPGGVDICGDGIDQDCANGDEDCDDADRDMDGYTTREGDCRDRDPDVNPGMGEIPYNGKDDDCDAATPDNDLDGDGFGALGEGDCDDNDPDVYPAAPEIPYDGVDQDCSGSDEEDVDEDGFRAQAVGGPDCDDARSDVNPSVTEIPYDELDQDCDGADVVVIGQALTTATGAQSFPVVSASASRFLSAWVDARSGSANEVFGRLVGLDGVPVGSEFIIRSAGTSVTAPRLAFGASIYLAVWVQGTLAAAEVWGVRLDTDGRLVGAPFNISEDAREEFGADVAYVEGGFVVSWVRRVDTFARRMMTRRVEIDGTLQTANTITSISLNSTAIRTRTEAGATGALVSWNAGGGGVQVMPINSTGASTGGTTALSSGTPGLHNLSFDGTNFLVVWDQTTGFPAEQDVFGRLVGPDGSPVSPSFSVSNAPDQQRNASAAFVSGEHMVLFQDTRFSVGTLFKQTIGTDGAPTGTTTIRNELLVAADTPARNPELAAAGGDALMVFDLDGDIHGALITP